MKDASKITTTTSKMPLLNRSWEPLGKLFISSGKPLELPLISSKHRFVTEPQEKSD